MTAAPCVEFAEELVAYLDGEQPRAEHARIEAHVGTCLSCRRELERLRRVRTLLGALPAIEPSAAFQDALWQRLNVAPPPLLARRRRRTLAWAAPALAAAAVLALVSYSLLARVTTNARVPGAPVAVAHREAPHGAAGEARVAAQHEKAPEKDEKQPDVAVAGSDLDQYPPELIEHPELFLRYPVVKRLQRLQHFEEVRQHGDGEPLGNARPNDTSSIDTIG